jgi:two-component system KDP operon response regulator KdpE
MSERGVNVRGDGTGTGNEPLVLIVEDDELLLRVMRLSLSTSGFQVIAATSGEEGLRLAAERRPDVVCLDLGLGGITGQGALSTFKEQFGLPVIVATGMTDEAVLLNCLSGGADDVLIKPFLPDDDLAPTIRFLAGLPEAGQNPGEQIRVGDIDIDSAYGKLTRGGDSIPLSRTEWRLFQVLLLRQGLPVLQKELISSVWGAGFQNHVKFLQAWMMRLSEKIDAGRPDRRLIADFLGVGYALGPEVSEPQRSPRQSRP